MSVTVRSNLTVILVPNVSIQFGSRSRCSFSPALRWSPARMDDDEAVRAYTKTTDPPDLLNLSHHQTLPSTSTTTSSSTTTIIDPNHLANFSTNMNATEASTSSVATTSSMSGMVVDNDFLSTGRTGRRNAMADILDEKIALLSTADLPDQLQSLSFGSSEPSTSSASCLHPGTSSSSSGAGPSTSSQP